MTYHSANGTDFTVWLIPQAKWEGGGETTLAGHYFNPNMPTEEIFTAPMAGKAEGTLVATKPLSYYGEIIDNFSITFQNGEAVQWQAKTGYEALSKMIESDQGARRLGEVALVPTTARSAGKISCTTIPFLMKMRAAILHWETDIRISFRATKA